MLYMYTLTHLFWVSITIKIAVFCVPIFIFVVHVKITVITAVLPWAALSCKEKRTDNYSVLLRHLRKYGCSGNTTGFMLIHVFRRGSTLNYYLFV